MNGVIGNLMCMCNLIRQRRDSNFLTGLKNSRITKIRFIK